MDVRKFNRFEELVASFDQNHDDALIFEDANFPGGKGLISYHLFRKLILNEAEEKRQNNQDVDFLRIGHAPSDLVRLFADVITGTDVVLTDTHLPEVRFAKLKLALEPKLKDLHKRPRENKEGRIIFFTSGTTNSSKAVVLTSEALLHAAWRGQMCLPILPEDILLSELPLSHVFGFVCAMLWAITNGAAVALSRGVRHITDDTLFFHPTVASLVPRLAEALANLHTFNPELRVVLIGAAPLSDKQYQLVSAETKAKIFTGYGLTETASGVAITMDPDDPNSMTVCPEVDLVLAEDGEILIRTDSLLECYVTPSVLPLHKGEERPLTKDGYFATGDIGLFDPDGGLHITGRKKDMLVLPDGNKLFCPEYESILTRDLGTDELAIILMDGRAKLVVTDEISREQAETAVQNLNKTLNRSVQLTDVIFIHHKLPRTVTGKLKRYLIERAIENGDYTLWE